MNYYEHTLVAKQDLSAVDVDLIEKKYGELINGASGKIIKIEKWGLINFAKKIKNYNKGHYIHYKFEGDKQTISEIDKKIKLDNSILRSLIVKCKKLNLEKEYFSKENEKEK
tara:strand:+ start:1328 stop:1663 length:336 start_codon:yes stop_codon:yes gene_type:complete